MLLVLLEPFHRADPKLLFGSEVNTGNHIDFFHNFLDLLILIEQKDKFCQGGRVPYAWNICHLYAFLYYSTLNTIFFIDRHHPSYFYAI